MEGIFKFTIFKFSNKTQGSTQKLTHHLSGGLTAGVHQDSRLKKSKRWKFQGEELEPQNYFVNYET